MAVPTRRSSRWIEEVLRSRGAVASRGPPISDRGPVPRRHLPTRRHHSPRSIRMDSATCNISRRSLSSDSKADASRRSASRRRTKLALITRARPDCRYSHQGPHHGCAQDSRGLFSATCSPVRAGGQTCSAGGLAVSYSCRPLATGSSIGARRPGCRIWVRALFASSSSRTETETFIYPLYRNRSCRVHLSNCATVGLKTGCFTIPDDFEWRCSMRG